MDKKMFVVIAEDDEVDRMLIEQYFEEKCPLISFHSTNNGQELLDYLAECKILPDVILSDLNMPRVNGLEALKAIREIKENNELRNIPFIIISTSISEKDHSAALMLGANKYLCKPNSFKEYSIISDAIFELASK